MSVQHLIDASAAVQFGRRHLLADTAGATAATLGLPRSTRARGQATPEAIPCAAPAGYTVQPTYYRTVAVDGLRIFYREAGDPSLPTILLLHGFPSSSHMFRDLIPLLAGRFHLVAPDYPGFGHSDAPVPEEFTYTFDHLADVVEKFVDALGLDRYSLYMQDYGGPVGFRLASRRPERIQSLIIQNTNAYEEGLTALSEPLRTSGQGPRTAESDAALRVFLAPETTIFQYTEGARDPERISPDAWTTDQHFLDRHGNDDIQLALFYNYLSNLEQYPEWHAYFRQRQPPALIAWGRGDPIFSVKGAEAYQTDLPGAELYLLETGHFAVEDHAGEIARLIEQFLTRHLQAEV